MFEQIPPDVHQKKVLAGVMGILLGTWGVHKFILGYSGEGITMLLVSLLSCCVALPVMQIIGLIEGIIYLSTPDDKFYETYLLNRKGWF